MARKSKKKVEEEVPQETALVEETAVLEETQVKQEEQKETSGYRHQFTANQFLDMVRANGMFLVKDYEKEYVELLASDKYGHMLRFYDFDGAVVPQVQDITYVSPGMITREDYAKIIDGMIADNVNKDFVHVLVDYIGRSPEDRDSIGVPTEYVYGYMFGLYGLTIGPCLKYGRIYLFDSADEKGYFDKIYSSGVGGYMENEDGYAVFENALSGGDELYNLYKESGLSLNEFMHKLNETYARKEMLDECYDLAKKFVYRWVNADDNRVKQLGDMIRLWGKDNGAYGLKI